jgi:hypothetical protein
MKNITRLALAFAVATIACLSPMAHAEDEAQLFLAPGGGIQLDRTYDYQDEDGGGPGIHLFVHDGPKYSWGRPISVRLYQNGHEFYGEGKRTLAGDGTNWFAYCEFWLHGSGTSAKFKGYIPIKDGYGSGGGEYFYNGFGPPHSWTCTLD